MTLLRRCGRNLGQARPVTTFDRAGEIFIIANLRDRVGDFSFRQLVQFDFDAGRPPRVTRRVPEIGQVADPVKTLLQFGGDERLR